MPGKTVPLSVRVSAEDAAFLANLEFEDAVTPSEKLRALLHEAQRRHAGLQDASEGGLILRDSAQPARRVVRRLEGKLKRKSDLVLKLYERVPDIMARLIAGPEDKTDPESLKAFERELTDQICVVMKDLLVLGLSSPVRVYGEENFRAEIGPVVDLVELIRHHQNQGKEKRNE
ncbi:MAG: hypothetical protein ACR2PI_19070 [Hyphomicrobiaceae bacterium]